MFWCELRQTDHFDSHGNLHLHAVREKISTFYPEVLTFGQKVVLAFLLGNLSSQASRFNFAALLVDSIKSALRILTLCLLDHF